MVPLASSIQIFRLCSSQHLFSCCVSHSEIPISAVIQGIQNSLVICDLLEIKQEQYFNIYYSLFFLKYYQVTVIRPIEEISL